MVLGVHGDPERYKDAYWSRFPGMYYSGDYALKDKDGYFWMLGRADEVLKVAGHRLGTAELEDAAISYPSVAESAVVGKADAVKGESIVMFVRLKDDAVPSAKLQQELSQHIRNVIGPIAVPDEIYFVSKLPRTRSGKVMRRVLKAVANNADNIGDLTTLEDETSVEEVMRSYNEIKSEKERAARAK
jgi:acetyl-CoA synthetase